MAFEEKVDLLFHTMITITEQGDPTPSPFRLPGAADDLLECN